MLAIELEDTGHLAAHSAGPLGDHVAHIWVDLAKPDLILIEVRLAGRSAARRTITVAGMRDDVAERLVALATAEMVRAVARPERPRKVVCPKETNSHEELPGERRLGLLWTGELAGAWLPASATYLAGPGASVGLSVGPLSQTLFARWLIGDGDTETTRWLEAGLGAHHLLLSRTSWRLSLGGSASAAAIRLVGARSVAGEQGTEDTWTARAAGKALLEGRIARNAWLGIALEPGSVLRTVPFEPSAGAPGSIQGAWLGLSLSLAVEHGLHADATRSR